MKRSRLGQTVCSGSYIYNFGGTFYGGAEGANAQSVVKALFKCHANKALAIVGNDQTAMRAALWQLPRRKWLLSSGELATRKESKAGFGSRIEVKNLGRWSRYATLYLISRG